MAKKATLIRGTTYTLQHDGKWFKFLRNKPQVVSDELADKLELAKDPVTIPASGTNPPQVMPMDKFSLESTAEEASAGRPTKRVRIPKQED
jgi:hypothetical protein